MLYVVIGTGEDQPEAIMPPRARARIALTVGQIARRLDEPLHRVEYAIRTRGIEPSAFAGNARIFEEDTIERVSAALRDIDAKREGGAACNP